MRESHYQNKSTQYGIAHTRLSRILKLAKVSGARVLDIGCARGYVGAKIKEHGNYVAGIEISKNAAEEAGKVLDKVYSFDIERDWPEEVKSEKFDLVIMAEVLEHVFDPVEVLKNVSSVLKTGGHIVITTPNFMTWTNRLKFLIGNFEYQDQGMFDFGHIRWFTYPYLKEVLTKSGFDITDERHIIFPGKLTRLLKRWPGVFAFQFIVKAQK